MLSHSTLSIVLLTCLTGLLLCLSSFPLASMLPYFNLFWFSSMASIKIATKSYEFLYEAIQYLHRFNRTKNWTFDFSLWRLSSSWIRSLQPLCFVYWLLFPLVFKRLSALFMLREKVQLNFWWLTSPFSSVGSSFFLFLLVKESALCFSNLQKLVREPFLFSFIFH